MKLSDWGFNAYERRAIWVLVLLILVGAAYRTYTKNRVASQLAVLASTQDESWVGIEPAQEPGSGADSLPAKPLSARAEETRTINVNTAGINELELLPGIGPVKAKAIIEYRRQYGDYQTDEDLLKIPGIGPVTLDKIRNRIYFE